MNTFYAKKQSEKIKRNSTKCFVSVTIIAERGNYLDFEASYFFNQTAQDKESTQPIY